MERKFSSSYPSASYRGSTVFKCAPNPKSMEIQVTIQRIEQGICYVEQGT